jgi:CheY-like chemotaxis protein
MRWMNFSHLTSLLEGYLATSMKRTYLLSYKQGNKQGRQEGRNAILTPERPLCVGWGFGLYPAPRGESTMECLNKKLFVLMADDDEDDCLMVKDAFSENVKNGVQVNCVEDGEELLDYLHRRGRFADKLRYPDPSLILLDLNMPKMGGLEALAEIRADEKLKMIPIVVLTTSDESLDIKESYTLGANSFITKPLSFEALVNIINSFSSYWFGMASLPECQLLGSEGMAHH